MGFWEAFKEVSRSMYINSLYFHQTSNAYVELNPFVPNAPFFYTLKTSDNLTVFWCFLEVKKGCIGNKWVKMFIIQFAFHKKIESITRIFVGFNLFSCKTIKECKKSTVKIVFFFEKENLFFAWVLFKNQDWRGARKSFKRKKVSY